MVFLELFTGFWGKSMAQVNSAADTPSVEASAKKATVVKEAPPTGAKDDRRAWQRFMLESPANITLQVSGHDDFEDIELVDVSLGGFRLQFDHDLPPGSDIAIDHPTAGTMRGKLAWQSGGNIGVRMIEDGNRRTYLLRLISMILHNEVRVASV